MAASFEAIHEDLKALKQFCIRAGKQPYIRDGSRNTFTSSGWPQHRQDWLTFNEALEALQKGAKVWQDGGYRPVDGIGFLVARNGQDGAQTLGGDLDCCRDPETGLVSPWAASFLQKVRPFYTEVSPSKCGLRFFCTGLLPDGRDKVFGNGSQDGLLEESRERILAAKPKAREKLAKGEPAFNGLELYESGRHLTITGWKVEEFCFPKEDQTEAIAEALEPFFVDVTMGKVAFEAKRAGQGGLPQLDILDVIDTRSFSESGGQLFGSHPTKGSTTGRNLVVNPTRGVWAYMHNGINSGGDAWLWLACECGVVAWEQAGAGALKDRAILEKTLRHAVSRGLISEDDAGLSRNPTIRAISLDDQSGSVGLDSDGTIKKVGLDKDGQKVLSWLSDCAVCIHTETVADNETEFTFKGVGAKDHRQISFTLPATGLADPRKFRAALINAFGACNRVGHLDFEIVQRLTRNTRLMRRVEVPAWDGTVPLIPGIGLADDVEFRLSAMTPTEVYDGDIEAAGECLRRLLGLHKYAPVLVAAVLGAPAFARWHSNDRFGVSLWGLTGSFKTSVVQAALSVYGTGYMDDEAILKHGKAGATQVATLEVFANAGILPQLLDNVKTVDEKDSLQYISTIQAVIEGREKQRGKKDGGLMASRVFNCTPIITGEIRPEEASTTARILNLTWTRPENLEALTYIQENVSIMPVIGYHWLRFLATTDLNLLDGFSEARGRKMAEFSAKRYTNPGRLATIYSLLRTTWALLCESPLGDVFGEFTERFVSALDQAIEDQGATVTEETEVEKFLVGLKELLASNPALVQGKDVTRTIIGKPVIGKWTGEGLFLLPNETLAELARANVFTQKPTVDSLTKGLHAAGKLIVKDKEHLKPQLRMNGVKARGWLLSKETCPLPSLLIGDAKNDSIKPNVSDFAGVASENERKKFSEGFRDEKQIHENTGYIGDTGDSIVNNNVIDSDLIGSKDVSGSVPGDKNDGDTPGRSKIGPHPRKNEPTPGIKLKSYSELAEMVAIDTSTPEAEKISKAFKLLLRHGYAPRLDFLEHETGLSREVISAQLKAWPWVRREVAELSGIEIFLPVEASA